MMIEITTPKKQVEIDYYYEIAKVIPINDPYGTPTFSQTSIDVSDAGDIYYLAREVPVGANTGNAVRYIFDSFESEHINDFWYSKFDGTGRANIETDSARQLDRTNYWVFSNPYLPDTKLNGLSSFEALSGVPLSKKYGEIQRIVMVNEVMLIVCQFNTVSVYPGRAMLKGTDDPLLVISDRVAGTVREQVANYGTHHPESLVVEEGNAWWFDVYRGAMVQYGYNGMQDVSYKMTSYFRDWGKKLYGKYIKTPIFGVYDRRYGEYILAFSRVEEPIPGSIEFNVIIEPETIAYMPTINRWVTRYSYHPEFMCSLGTEIFSWIAGRAWQHDTGTSWNDFYQAKDPLIFRMVGNIFAPKNKVFETINLETNDPNWYAPDIRTPEYLDQDKNRLSEQVTILEKDDFVVKEGLLTANFNRDTSNGGDLDNGRNMRGHYIVVELRNDQHDLPVIAYEIKIGNDGSEWSGNR